ncbi:MAG: glycosyltransferase [Patescibacteria group bacterium]|jgi:hypothetical protein
MLNKQLDYLFIIPTYNEANIIKQSVLLLLKQFEQQWQDTNKTWLLVVADNGSSDNAEQILQPVLKNYPNKLVYQYIKPAGRGNALVTIAQQYNVPAVCYIDADIPIEPAGLLQLLHAVTHAEADVAIIKRTGTRPVLRSLLSEGFKLLNSSLFNLTVQDAQCGAKALSRKALHLLASQCKEKGYFLDTELLVLCVKEKLTIKEIALPWIEQRYANRTSKIRPVKDSLKAALAMWRILARVQPRVIIDTSLFMIAGGILLAVFWLASTQFAPTNFLVVQQFDAFDNWDRLFISMSISYVVLIDVILITKLPWKLQVILTGLLFGGLLIMAVLMQPIGSQDIYWNLLYGKLWSQYQVNPYQVPLSYFSFDSWSYTVKAWRDLTMTHGPIWVYLLGLATVGVAKLSGALLLIKLLQSAALIGAVIMFWKLTGLITEQLNKRAKWLALFALNPWLIQMVIIDVHNDVFIMLGIIVSYYLLLRKKYSGSILVLLLAGLVKYVSWFLMPIPLYYWLKTKTNMSGKMISLITILVGCAVIVMLAYYPFGNVLSSLTGISNEVTERGNEPYFTIGAYWLTELFHVTISQIRLLGLVVALLVMWLCLKFKKDWLAYTMPYVAILLLSTTWFQPWYGLWLLPLFIIYLPIPLLILFTTCLLFTPTVLRPLEISVIFVGVLGLYLFSQYLAEYVLKRLNHR